MYLVLSSIKCRTLCSDLNGWNMITLLISEGKDKHIEINVENET